MMDSLDAIMAVMECAFDPEFGEAWNRRQVGDALTFPNTYFLLSDAQGQAPATPQDAVGFTLSRMAADEEELLLIAVKPDARGRGVGNALLQKVIHAAEMRGVRKLFLEMRDKNPAQRLYLHHDFQPVGRRINYYRSGKNGPYDAITYAKDIDTYAKDIG